MNYCKITSDKQAMNMPNPYHLTVSNATDEQKKVIAEFDNWLEKVNTNPPEYDHETQYAVSHWEEIDGKAVQVWEVHDLPPEEPSIEERVGDLEEAFDALTDGEAE